MNYMDIIYGVVYGLIQGISEFLPVSSSGHLALFPYLAHFKDPGLVFDLAMHIGTALAVILYFYKDIILIIKSFFEFILKKSSNMYGVNFIISTFCSGVLVFVLKDFASTYGRNPRFIALNLIIFGILLYISDKYSKSEKANFSTTKGILASVVIGASQVLAIFPGVSRSGITITSARFMGINRDEAASFSFLLSLPIILGGALLKYLELKDVSESLNISMCLTGVLVSFVTGFVTIHFFMKLIKKINFTYFMIYRIIIAILVLVIAS